MEIIPFEAEHALYIPRRPEDDFIVDDPNYLRWALGNQDAGPAWTAVCDDRPIACAGIRIMWPGTGEAWAILCQAIGKYWRVHRVIKDQLEQVIYERDLHRVQAYARVDMPQDGRYLKYLGFHFEAFCEKYGPGGKDYFLYARID